MQTKGKNFTGFSGNQLKVFAILAMALDHLAWTLWPGYDNKVWWLLGIHLWPPGGSHHVVYDCRGLSLYEKPEKVSGEAVRFRSHIPFCLHLLFRDFLDPIPEFRAESDQRNLGSGSARRWRCM